MPLLDSFQLRNFRLFENLDVPFLGQVNLVVGRNNVGKTTLLEAAALYARSGATDDIARLLYARGEIGQDARKRVVLRMDRLFSDSTRECSIGPPERLLSFTRGRARRLDDGARWIEVEAGGVEAPEDEDVVWVQPPRARKRFIRLAAVAEEALARNPIPGLLPCWYIPAHGLEDDEIAELANQIALTPRDPEAVRALRTIVTGIDAVQVVDVGDERIPMAGTAAGRVPLRSFGDGVVRLYALAAALSACESGLVLVDEFEAGLHYSALADAWRLVFTVARERSVQVIAATHNADCIRGFLDAAIEAEAGGGTAALIRLTRSATAGSRAQVYSGEALHAAAREQVEVR